MTTKTINLEKLKREWFNFTCDMPFTRSALDWAIEQAYHSAAAKWQDVITYDAETGTVAYAANGVILGHAFADVDGYEKFWPSDGGGFWEPFVLRAISDLVDELNEKWDREIQEWFDAAEARERA